MWLKSRLSRFGSLFLLCCFGSTSHVQAGIDTWTPLGFSTGETIYDYAISTSDHNTLFLVTNNLYRTSNGGGSWVKDFSLPPAVQPNCVTFDPLTPSNVYVGDYAGAGILKSATGGGNWSTLNLNLAVSGDSIDRIVVDPANSNVVIAGSWWGYIYRSTDGGISWTNTQLPGASKLDRIVFNPQNHNILYAGCLNGGEGSNLFKSVDNGVTWNLSSNGVEALSIKDIAIDSFNPNTLYVACDTNLVYKSVNAGGSWTSSSYGITATDSSQIEVTSVAVSPFDHNQVFATTTYNGIYRSINGGNSWLPYNKGIDSEGSPLSNCDFLRFDPIDPKTLFTVAGANDIYVITMTTTKMLFVPVLLDYPGAAGSHYTSELTLTNKGSKDAQVHFAYTGVAGGGTGSAEVVLPAGHQIIKSNAIDYLRSLGLGFDGSGKWLGTMLVTFTGISSFTDAAVTVRTTTATSGGQAGLAYAGAPADSLLTGVAYLCGLHQTDSDRSNVAFQNAGTADDGPVTLDVTVYPADPTLPSKDLDPITLQPGGFQQINTVLTNIGAAEGYIKVSRVGGNAPYYAYAVVNDAFNSDGSFITPKVEPPNIPAAMTIPVAVDTGVYSTEVVVTNLDPLNRPKNFTLSFVAANVNTLNHTVSATIPLLAGQQVTIPNIITYLRNNNPDGTIPAGSIYAGPLYVTSTDMTGVAVGARTLNPNPNGQGRFGLFYPAVPFGSSSVSSAWLYGLQQNDTNRTNLAIINSGEVNDDSDTFEIDIYNGDTGLKVNPTVTTDIGGNPLIFTSKQWKQLNMILANKAAGISNAYVQVRKISGSNPFITYAVINDGAAPGARTGDGAFIASGQ
jgi:photosystem II stability/assembly factor-like uncharacterized protein